MVFGVGLWFLLFWVVGFFYFQASSASIPFDDRCVPAERPKPAALQTIETDDISLFIRKPDQNIESELAAVPPLAVRCSLKDVVPKNAVSKSCLYYFRIFFLSRKIYTEELKYIIYIDLVPV